MQPVYTASLHISPEIQLKRQIVKTNAENTKLLASSDFQRGASKHFLDNFVGN